MALDEAQQREAEEAARAAAVAAAAAEPPRSRPGPRIAGSAAAAGRVRLSGAPHEPGRRNRRRPAPAGQRTGSRTRITVRPGTESTEISPWWWSVTIRREMSRPSPVPWPTGLVV